MPRGDADRGAGPAPTIFRLRNLRALPGWLLTLGFLLLISHLTLTLRRDGPDWGYPPWLQQAALLAFWVGGFLGVGHLVRRPLIWTRVTAEGEVVVTRLWPGWARRDRYPRTAVAAVAVREQEDGDGDPYFRTRLMLSSGEAITVREGYREDAQKAAAEGLRGAIGLGR